MTLYQLTHDKYPFTGRTHVELNSNITKNEPEYDEALDVELIQLLKGLLCKDPADRFNFDLIRKNKWLNKNDQSPLESV